VVIEGAIVHVTFQNPETQYTVARFRPREGGQITVVGHLVGLRSGERLRLEGSWERHRRFGPQFAVSCFQVLRPADVEGIRAYLAGGTITSLGPAMAERLVAFFGADTLAVLDAGAQDRLRAVPGIGPRRAAAICEAWAAHHELRGLMRFLQSHGVSPAYTARIHRCYGTEAEALLRRDPYRLAQDLPGIGFVLADTLATSLGLAADAPARVAACLHYLVDASCREGHVWTPREALLGAAEQRFGIDRIDAEVGLAEQLAAGTLVEAPIPDEPDDTAIYPAMLHAAERAIARRLAACMAVPPPEAPPAAEEISRRVFAALAIAPSPEQLEVLEASLAQRVAIVTGGPGTGKTTLIRAYGALAGAAGRRVLLAAPTGRAARRLAQVTGRPASTVHRLLGLNPSEGGFFHGADNPLDVDALIVDEASMLDTEIAHHLIQALPLSARLLLVGDAFQLPSVGPGSVLADLVASQRLPVYELTAIFRQAAASPIVVNAHRLRQGRMPDLAAAAARDAEFRFIEVEDPAAVVDTVVDLCGSLARELDCDPIREVQVLTPMHRGEAGTVNLNAVLQKALNPDSGGGARFQPGDKLMHLKNNYAKEIFNGDIGIVTGPADKGGLAVEFDGRRVVYASGEEDDLALAYAITVHKSQGSEYPAVIVPLLTQHYPLLQRNLLYTALTRGRERVVVIGTRKALAVAVHNDRPSRRRTGLMHRLVERLDR
jgi:exodeoxyribonuclease V alpha subunit